MFTGIIEAMCPLAALQRGATWRLTVDLGPLADDVKLGDSIAINGVCLTVAHLNGSRASFDAIGETMGRTALARLAQDDRVNIERALRVGDRLGGHFVAGHVDGVGTLRAKEQRPDQTVVRVAIEPALTRFMAAKGSVAIDGISLTLVDVAHDTFSVAIIPYTLRETTLGVKHAGDPVNVEVDLLARYVAKMTGHGDGLTEGFLREHGFC
ncbi:MAG: riboflavin synthase [Candidatus Brocadiae bacterium]|nr:riboflavin synthase [Candidatus Brocadiia bacterium]